MIKVATILVFIQALLFKKALLFMSVYKGNLHIEIWKMQKGVKKWKKNICVLAPQNNFIIPIKVYFKQN